LEEKKKLVGALNRLCGKEEKACSEKKGLEARRGRKDVFRAMPRGVNGGVGENKVCEKGIE